MNPHHIGNAFHIQRRGLKMTVDDLNKAFADILFPIRRTGGILTAFDRPYREIMKKTGLLLLLATALLFFVLCACEW